MIHFKVCPRCHGDLYLTQDIFGEYVSCLQCGYLKDIEKPAGDKPGSALTSRGQETVGAGA
jgi:DNA-directed RNA polymerase subunit M/transcription elongation factor TFIIS